jgi:hypothetical protein
MFLRQRLEEMEKNALPDDTDRLAFKALTRKRRAARREAVRERSIRAIVTTPRLAPLVSVGVVPAAWEDVPAAVLLAVQRQPVLPLAVAAPAGRARGGGGGAAAADAHAAPEYVLRLPDAMLLEDEWEDAQVMVLDPDALRSSTGYKEDIAAAARQVARGGGGGGSGGSGAFPSTPKRSGVALRALSAEEAAAAAEEQEAVLTRSAARRGVISARAAAAAGGGGSGGGGGGGASSLRQVLSSPPVTPRGKLPLPNPSFLALPTGRDDGYANSRSAEWWALYCRGGRSGGGGGGGGGSCRSDVEEGNSKRHRRASGSGGGGGGGGSEWLKRPRGPPETYDAYGRRLPSHVRLPFLRYLTERHYVDGFSVEDAWLAGVAAQNPFPTQVAWREAPNVGEEALEGGAAGGGEDAAAAAGAAAAAVAAAAEATRQKQARRQQRAALARAAEEAAAAERALAAARKAAQRKRRAQAEAPSAAAVGKKRPRYEEPPAAAHRKPARSRPDSAQPPSIDTWGGATGRRKGRTSTRSSRNCGHRPALRSGGRPFGGAQRGGAHKGRSDRGGRRGEVVDEEEEEEEEDEEEEVGDEEGEEEEESSGILGGILGRIFGVSREKRGAVGKPFVGVPPPPPGRGAGHDGSALLRLRDGARPASVSSLTKLRGGERAHKR